MFFRNKADKDKKEKTISTKQVSVLPNSAKQIYPDNRKILNLLKEINDAQRNIDAVDVLITKTPDGKMAYNTYLRLANQGIDFEVHNKSTGRIVKKYDTEVREFCERALKNDSCGIDGLIDQLHGSAIARGGMACEVVVSEGLDDIEEVVIVDPKTFVEYKWLEDKKRYAIYQQSADAKEKRDLYDGNFIWIPHQPKPGRPDGTLQFEPAIPTMTEYYQLLNDLSLIRNRIALPRYLCEINRADLLESATPAQKSTPEAQAKLFRDAFDQCEEGFRRMGKDNDIITFDSNKISILGGGINGSGIDVRAWLEPYDYLIPNSFTMTPVSMGRLKTGSYSLGTAEYGMLCDTVDTMRRASKRMLEQILNLWARVKGYNVYIKVTHNPINWQTEIDKLEVELKKMQKARRAEEYQWLTHDEAAQVGMGLDKASEKNTDKRFEYLKSAESTTEQIDVEENKNGSNKKETEKQTNGSDNK